MGFVTIGTVVDLIRYFLVAVAFLCGRKLAEINRHKAIAIRPSQRKHGKSLLVFMFHMAVYLCEKFHSFVTVTFDHRILRNQYFTCSGLIRLLNTLVTFANGTEGSASS